MDFRLCYLFEERIISYEGKSYEILKLHDVVFCLFDIETSKYKHISGSFENISFTNKKFKFNGKVYELFDCNLEDCLGIYQTYNLNEFIKKLKEDFKMIGYFTKDCNGNFVSIYDKKLYYYVRKRFDEKVIVNHYDFLVDEDPRITLSSIIGSLKNIKDIDLRNKAIDDELDSYNNYIKRKKSK